MIKKVYLEVFWLFLMLISTFRFSSKFLLFPHDSPLRFQCGRSIKDHLKLQFTRHQNMINLTKTLINFKTSSLISPKALLQVSSSIILFAQYWSVASSNDFNNNEPLSSAWIRNWNIYSLQSFRSTREKKEIIRSKTVDLLLKTLSPEIASKSNRWFPDEMSDDVVRVVRSSIKLLDLMQTSRAF